MKKFETPELEVTALVTESITTDDDGLMGNVSGGNQTGTGND